MWQRLRTWLQRFSRRPAAPDEPREESPYAHLGEHHAAHPGDTDPEELHRGRRRLKETFTNHWDLDYLPRDQAEEILRDKKPKKE